MRWWNAVIIDEQPPEKDEHDGDGQVEHRFAQCFTAAFLLHNGVVPRPPVQVGSES